jgi:uncharacterized sporulation protein YeaH/YhbH (DUF444 family)
MKPTIKLIRELISARSNPKAYAEEIGVKVGTMYDFLNQKKGINVNTFFKIINPLGLKVGRDKVSLIEVDVVYIDGVKYKKGDAYESKEVILCFGDASSSMQYMLLRGKEKKSELVIC